MVHCGRIGKSIVGIFRPAWTDCYGETTEFMRCTKAVLVGHVVSEEYGPRAGKGRMGHEGTYGSALVRTRAHQFGNELATLQYEAVRAGKLRHEMRGVFLLSRLRARMERRTMRLGFVVQTDFVGIIGDLRDDMVGQRLRRLAQHTAICQALVGPMGPGAGDGQFPEMMLKIVERASTDKRKPSVKLPTKVFEPPPQSCWHCNPFRRGGEIDESSVKIEKKRDWQLFAKTRERRRGG